MPESSGLLAARALLVPACFPRLLLQIPPQSCQATQQPFYKFIYCLKQVWFLLLATV